MTPELEAALRAAKALTAEDVHHHKTGLRCDACERIENAALAAPILAAAHDASEEMRAECHRAWQVERADIITAREQAEAARQKLAAEATEVERLQMQIRQWIDIVNRCDERERELTTEVERLRAGE